jgi:hypothetical protein
VEADTEREELRRGLCAGYPSDGAREFFEKRQEEAYDPEDLIANADGSKTLKVLWDSQQWNIQYLFNKFLPPTVWNGRVYLPNYNGGVDVYALAP